MDERVSLHSSASFMLNLCVFKLELKCLTKLLLKTRVYRREREGVCVNCQCSGEQKMRALSQPYVVVSTDQ